MFIRAKCYCTFIRGFICFEDVYQILRLWRFLTCDSSPKENNKVSDLCIGWLSFLSHTHTHHHIHQVHLHTSTPHYTTSTHHYTTSTHSIITTMCLSASLYSTQQHYLPASLQQRCLCLAVCPDALSSWVRGSEPLTGCLMTRCPLSHPWAVKGDRDLLSQSLSYNTLLTCHRYSTLYEEFGSSHKRGSVSYICLCQLHLRISCWFIYMLVANKAGHSFFHTENKYVPL